MIIIIIIIIIKIIITTTTTITRNPSIEAGIKRNAICYII